MSLFTIEELEEALRSITSTISKSEKAQLKLKANTFQHTRLVREIKAYCIATELIKRESEGNISEDLVESKYTNQELEEAIQAIASAVGRCEEVLPKLKTGSSQHTLTIRRIKAFHITADLIKRQLD